ncbi:MAG: hypothetical protein M0Q38_01430 [Bacteroidales bacterium]|jgi:hypothetical protein|nr:hypothetical protein [Bacteroidales bacterium]
MAEQRESLIANKYLNPKRGNDKLSRCSEDLVRYPSLGITNPNHVPEEVALDYLASLLVEAFLDKKEYERKQLQQPKTGGNLRPSVDQRTG